MPPAPPTFSMITCWPRTSERRAPRIRPITSPAPPAANGMIMVSGLVGQACAGDCADAGVPAARRAATPATVPTSIDNVIGDLVGKRMGDLRGLDTDGQVGPDQAPPSGAAIWRHAPCAR